MEALPMKRLSVFLLLLGLSGASAVFADDGKYPSKQKALDACIEWAKETRVRQTNPSEYDIGSGWEYLYTRGCGYKLTEDGSRVENVWLAKEGVIPKKAGSWRFDRGQIIGDDWNEVKQFRY